METPSRDFEGCSPNSLKGVSSRLLRQKRPDLAARYWKGVLWSPSYSAASCGVHLSTFLRTISDNRKHQSEKRASIPGLKDRGFTPERVNAATFSRFTVCIFSPPTLLLQHWSFW
jgi:hypothetical protein